MDEYDDFMRFHLLCQNPNGEWYIRAVEQEDDGSYYFLAFDQPTNLPRVAKIGDSYQLTCKDKNEANVVLVDYYAYHGSSVLNEDPTENVVGSSRVMEFE